MLSKNKLFKCIDVMFDNFYNSKDTLQQRLDWFNNWLSCSFSAGLVNFEDYDKVQAYGSEKIKNMGDY